MSWGLVLSSVNRSLCMLQPQALFPGHPSRKGVLFPYSSSETPKITLCSHSHLRADHRDEGMEYCWQACVICPLQIRGGELSPSLRS